jgi:hypothetical protein
MGQAKEQLLFKSEDKNVTITVKHNAGMTLGYIVRRTLGLIGLQDIVIEYGAEQMNEAENMAKALDAAQSVYTSKYPVILS